MEVEGPTLVMSVTEVEEDIMKTNEAGPIKVNIRLAGEQATRVHDVKTEEYRCDRRTCYEIGAAVIFAVLLIQPRDCIRAELYTGVERMDSCIR